MLTVQPYPYQDEAIDLVLDLGYGLIAYEMGLGKTLVGIAAIEEFLAEDAIDHALIVVPSGLKYQWAESIASFTDVETKQRKVGRRRKGKKTQEITIPTEQYCVVIDGSPKKRAEQYALISEHNPDYIICGYETVVSDWEMIAPLGEQCVVIDEATAIKGFKAARSKAIKALEPEFPIALTGTPMENRPEEVYSIMEFVCPGYLGRFDLFDTKYIVRNYFGGVKRYQNLDILHKKLAKVMARKTRLDPDVAPYMPEVDHKEEYVTLGGKARKLYDQIAAQVVKDLKENPIIGDFNMAAYYAGEAGQDMGAQGKIMAKLGALQMLCDHPDLLKISAEKYVMTEGEQGSAFAAELAEAGKLEDLGGSEKFVALLEDVRDLLDSNPENKVIIFSFFKDMGRMMQESFEEFGSVLYNGDMTSSEKAAAKAKFQQDPDCRLFIASDAGAFGVDLPQANYLINYDQVESAGKMDQRNARHVRAGSKHKKVFVVNYLVEGSIEERIFARLNFKRKVSRAVVDGKMKSSMGEIENDVASLMEFLDIE